MREISIIKEGNNFNDLGLIITQQYEDKNNIKWINVFGTNGKQSLIFSEDMKYKDFKGYSVIFTSGKTNLYITKENYVGHELANNFIIIQTKSNKIHIEYKDFLF